ncbi:hypothetical protein CAPTEDRAFT_208747, partial [Capitella teleta]
MAKLIIKTPNKPFPLFGFNTCQDELIEEEVEAASGYSSGHGAVHHLTENQTNNTLPSANTSDTTCEDSAMSAEIPMLNLESYSHLTALNGDLAVLSKGINYFSCIPVSSEPAVNNQSQTEEPCVDEMQYDTILPCVFLEEEVDPIGEDGVT